MQMIIADEDLIYSEKFRNYYFKFDSGQRTDYFRIIDDSIKVIDNIMTKHTFRVIQSRKSGYHMVVPAQDTSNRCLLFIGFKSNSYEVIELDDMSKADIICHYSNPSAHNTEQVKMIVIITPKKPLIVKYISKLENYQHRNRYEFIAYNAITNKIDRRILSNQEREDLHNNQEIIDNYEFDYSQVKVTKEMLENLTPDKIKEVQAYASKYWSPLKDL